MPRHVLEHLDEPHHRELLDVLDELHAGGAHLVAADADGVEASGRAARRSSRITRAACKPELLRRQTISRTHACRASRRVARHHPRRQAAKTSARSLDVVDDRKRDGKRLAAVVARDGRRPVAGHRSDESLQLEPQRLAVRRVDHDALDRDSIACAPRVADERREVHVAPKTVDLAGPGREVGDRYPLCWKIRSLRMRSRDTRLAVMFATA